jgi:hypothetical protein
MNSLIGKASLTALGSGRAATDLNERMTKSEIIQRIRDIGVIPVVRASSAEEAIQVVEAIRAGGVSVLEITMTVPGAVKVIEELVNDSEMKRQGAGRCWIRSCQRLHRGRRSIHRSPL